MDFNMAKRQNVSSQSIVSLWSLIDTTFFYSNSQILLELEYELSQLFFSHNKRRKIFSSLARMVGNFGLREGREIFFLLSKIQRELATVLADQNQNDLFLFSMLQQNISLGIIQGKNSTTARNRIKKLPNFKNKKYLF